MNRLGESGPGCSAHAEGCDGSTGTQRIVGLVPTVYCFCFISSVFCSYFLFQYNFSFANTNNINQSQFFVVSIMFQIKTFGSIKDFELISNGFRYESHTNF